MSDGDKLVKRLQSLVWVPDGEIDDTRFEKLYSSLSETLTHAEGLHIFLERDGPSFVQSGLLHDDERVRSVSIRLVGDLVVAHRDDFHAPNSAKQLTAELAWLEFRRCVGMEIQKHEERPAALEETPLTLSAQLKAFQRWIPYFLNKSASSTIEFEAAISGIITLVERGLADSSHFVQSDAVSLLSQLSSISETNQFDDKFRAYTVNAIIRVVEYLRECLHANEDGPGIGAPTLVLQFIDSCVERGAIKIVQHMQLATLCWDLTIHRSSLVSQRARDTTEALVKSPSESVISLLLGESAPSIETSLLRTAENMFAAYLLNGNDKYRQCATIRLLGSLQLRSSTCIAALELQYRKLYQQCLGDKQVVSAVIHALSKYAKSGFTELIVTNPFVESFCASLTDAANSSSPISSSTLRHLEQVIELFEGLSFTVQGRSLLCSSQCGQRILASLLSLPRSNTTSDRLKYLALAALRTVVLQAGQPVAELLLCMPEFSVACVAVVESSASVELLDTTAQLLRDIGRVTDVREYGAFMIRLQISDALAVRATSSVDLQPTFSEVLCIMLSSSDAVLHASQSDPILMAIDSLLHPPESNDVLIIAALKFLGVVFTLGHIGLIPTVPARNLLHVALAHEELDVRQEACFSMSSIAKSHQSLFIELGGIHRLAQMTKDPLRVVREAAWAALRQLQTLATSPNVPAPSPVSNAELEEIMELLNASSLDEALFSEAASAIYDADEEMYPLVPEIANELDCAM